MQQIIIDAGKVVKWMPRRVVIVDGEPVIGIQKREQRAFILPVLLQGQRQHGGGKRIERRQFCGKFVAQFRAMRERFRGSDRRRQFMKMRAPRFFERLRVKVFGGQIQQQFDRLIKGQLLQAAFDFFPFLPLRHVKPARIGIESLMQRCQQQNILGTIVDVFRKLLNKIEFLFRVMLRRVFEKLAEFVNHDDERGFFFVKAAIHRIKRVKDVFRLFIGRAEKAVARRPFAQ